MTKVISHCEEGDGVVVRSPTGDWVKGEPVLPIGHTLIIKTLKCTYTLTCNERVPAPKSGRASRRVWL